MLVRTEPCGARRGDAGAGGEGVGAERVAGGRGCLGLEDCLADDVLRRDEFELALLSIELGGQHARDVGVGGLKAACK